MYKNLITDWLANHKSTTLPGWLNRNPVVKDWVIFQTSNYITKNIMESVYIILNGVQPVCEYNNPKQFNTFEIGYRKGCVLGNKCKCISNLRMESLKITLIDKYGVENANCIPGILEKRQATMVERYGVPVASQSELFKEKSRNTIKRKSVEERNFSNQKRKNTSIERYGVEHHMQLQSQQEKLFSTNMEKYNAKVPMQNIDIRNKSRETYAQKTQLFKELILTKTQNTLNEKYGVTAASRIDIPTDILEILDDKDKLSNVIFGKTRKEVLNLLNIASHTLYLYAKKYDIQGLFLKDTSSGPETEINEYVKSLGFDTEIGNRTILNGKEIDIFISKLNIAIEYGGLYYHSEISGRGKQYHYNKYIKCLQQDITLITIFGDEWEYNQDKVKHRLNHILNKTFEKTYARKCIIKEISYKESVEFINKYHLQGSVYAKINIGLFYNNELVAVMNFAKSRYNKKYQYEILRFCSSINVVGGASKLFKYFIKQYAPESVISYSDNRWGNGNVYTMLGMTKEKETIGFFYTDYHKRYNRTKFQKHKLVAEGHDASLTAKEIMKNSKYDIIWDCGQSMWVWKNNKRNEVI